MSLVYTNSFLTMLNSRSTIADEIELNPSGVTSQESTARGINFRIESMQDPIQDEEQATEVTRDVSFSKHGDEGFVQY